jgi:acetyl esterase/lipase
MWVCRAFERATATAAAMASTVAAAKACIPALVLNAVIPGEGYIVVKGIAYGSDPRQRLDIYAPSGYANSAPVLVFFYGGGWKRGKRSYYRFVGEAFASRGYMVVVPDYRLYPSVRFPRFVEDGARGVEMG